MFASADKWKEISVGHPAQATDVPWYIKEMEEHKLKPSFRRLLEEWSGIPPDEVVPHIYRVRDEAWRVFPWPCIGHFWFVEQGLLRHPEYPNILERMTSTNPAPKFLDLGTCLGQDLRTLAHAGAPVSSLYGADVEPNFEAAGHSMFRDEDRFDHSHFVIGNIFGDGDQLAGTRGTWDIIHISMFLHLFPLPEQKVATANVFRLLKAAPGSTIIGTQTGSLDAGEVTLKPPAVKPGEVKTMYRQNKETMKDLLEKAAEEVGVKAKVWTDYDEEEVKRLNAKRAAGGGEWGKKWEQFEGEKERRIFFRVDLL
ncbi:hypothetical protein GGR52DRAFT_560994 [Hypoxylon sp. FL1284]|nr:hypothetical protein GGR52DRAFT_560994 [Hypoxylon sp. FL1284]